MASQTSLILRVAAAAAALFCAASAHAWPDRLVKVIVPAPAGGNIDVIARVYADYLAKESGQTVVIENKAGAGGGIGTQVMLMAPPDGHTILFTNSNVLAEVPHVLKPPFDPMKDVKAVAMLARFRYMLVGSPSLPANDLASLGKHLKTLQGKASFASPSPGTLAHLGGDLLNRRFETDMQHIPFSGSPAALGAVMGGQVTLYIDGVVTAGPLVRGGKLKPFAIAGATRFAQMPNVPTFAEAGVPELSDFINYMGVAVSQGVPAAVTGRIYAVTAKIAANREFQAKLAELGFEPLEPTAPDQFARTLQSDYARNGEFVRKMNFKP
jgi:tripartite-type tricarboxylate transporter receptor subunit TctC